jgi:hypothetical protein
VHELSLAQAVWNRRTVANDTEVNSPSGPAGRSRCRSARRITPRARREPVEGGASRRAR